MRQTHFARSQPVHISSFLLTLTLALAATFFSACSGGGSESNGTASGTAANNAAPSSSDAGATAGAPASSGSSVTASTATAVTATNPYDTAMQKLSQAESYHFILTTDENASGGAGRASHSVADGLFSKSNKAMQFKLESNAEGSQSGEWIDIGNGKQAFHKVDGAWTNQGFITPPGVGFNLHMLLSVVTMRNATDPSNNAPPTSLGSETIDGQDCDHYRVKLPEQTYDVYLSRATGDVVRAELTDSKHKQTLSISRLNEPVNIAPPI